MSENHVAEQLPKADSDSNSGPHMGHDHVIQPNGITESTTDTYQDQVERVDLTDGVLVDAEDGKSTEDTARDDMFVDCPDELTTFDGRQKEEEATVAGNEDEKLEENEVLHQQQSQFVELGNGVGDDYPTGQLEVEQLRHTLEKAVAEKESVLHEYQELLSVKDREIEDLNAKVSQLRVSNESLQVSSETQLEKDRNIETVIDKTISSLATVVNQEQVLDNSMNGKIVYIEEGTELLIAKYNQMLLEIHQLGQSFSEVGLDTREQEYGNILVDARGGLLDLKRKEAELAKKLAGLEDENRKLVEELDKEKVMIGTLNTELENMKIELEQEKVKCANTKEKLSMAVTKGKALVQQRDSLKMSLADKSSELEKCLIELQEKSVALEAAELAKEELARSENMVASLQNSLLQNNTIFDRVKEILSHAEPDQPEMFDMPERLRWLVDDRIALKGAFLELCKLKDALSLVDLPEPVSSSDFESQMNWLRDSFHRARDDMYILQEEISTIKEASRNNIDLLSISLLLELQEKDYLQSELTDLRFKYEELLGKNHHISLEKDQIVKMLVDLSGLNLENEGIDQFSSSTSMIIDLCFQNIKGQSGPFSTASHIDAELFERIQSLLYVRDQGLKLYEDMLEEDMLIRSDVNKLSNELKVASEEIVALKEERSSLLKDLEQSEEKCAMLRDKLSMAVKKGKGLVQDRDNLKGILNEKNTEIEQLKVDLQKQESAVSEYRDQINILSSDVESIPKLEADLLEMKRERNQFEQFLLESNTMLQRVIECIDGIILPVDLDFGEPMEKVKWLVGYVSECQDAKVQVEQELQLVKEQASILETKLAEAQATVNSLEQGLSSSEDSLTQIVEEKRELEHEKTKVEEELQKVKEKNAEVCSTTKSLEEALSQAGKDIFDLSNKKEQAEVGRVAAETELERVKEETARQTSKLAEASTSIKDLEDKLSLAESNVNLLTEKYNADQVVKTDMENDLKKLQDEAENHAGKLVGASATIKSLEDALLKAQDDISALEDANKIAKQEISSLGLKLNSCMEELAGKSGSLESRSLELIGLLNDLQVHMKDKTLFPKIKQCFERKCETLKNMDLILNKIRYHIAMNSKDSDGHLMMEEDPLVRKAFLDDLENFEVELDSREINGTDIDTIISSFGKIVKGFQLRNKHIADKFDEFSYSIDEFISPLHEKILETETYIMTIFEQMDNMKEKANTMEKLKEEKENIITILENDISVLLSACTDATSELQIEVDKNIGQPGSFSEVEKLNIEADSQAEHHKNSKYADAAQKLINASRKAQTLIRQFEHRSEQVAATIEDLQNKLRETTVAFELVTDERDLNKNRVLQLESDSQLLRSDFSELRDRLEGYHALEEKLKEKEAEISSMNSALFAKEEESSLLSASQVRNLFDKIDRIQIPIVESEEVDMEPHTSAPSKKLFYIIDSVSRLHHHINTLSRDKEELQSILETKALEIKDLKEEVKQLNRNCEDSKMGKNELLELTFALEKIMDILGASDWVVDRKSKGMKELMPALEKHIMAILSESENSKSMAQELGINLVGSQKVIDELTTKVKLLEHSLQDRTSEPDIVQERSIFEAPSLPAGSEITEVEEGSLGKKPIAPVPSAAHVRNMRKGSSDHLALDINVESDPLINSADTDEDKGHVFKSLNTSGFVPKQGKLIADRIDGIWVSGGRILMSRPRARLGLIGYLFIMHIWLLGTIL
ncbi:trans-Golgi network-localized SYP41-interacting protein 1 isoform X3 [Gastrolobium bilobum]|uniref:trans-Golgi network-localized SYP41-interacting protein 1 isoform X3 n=1 Tax=Gastrolobium bilobum TaxID=150636 RepID=UPI002AB09CBA|nr:trans-Golgi network-localized SYP41-interacting protein 1 isoform X3 [Gastrolobium bilobum]